MLGRIGVHEIVGILGVGGMGVVFKGFDATLNRYVAIKLLSPLYHANGIAKQRFLREAQSAAAVIHDNVIAIHSIDHWRDTPYLVMTYVRGESLRQRLSRRGALSVREVLRVGMQIAAGLSAAHSQGLIHRDIKPANILLETGVDRVKISDFGLARAVDDIRLTQSNTLIGTPQYMSPEQARDEVLDYRTDLFSLGSVLYEACTGRAPFYASTSYGVLRRIVENRPPSVRRLNPDIPDWLERVIEKLMAKDRELRFSDASEVEALLRQCLAHIEQPQLVSLPAAVSPPRSSVLVSLSKWRVPMAVSAIGLIAGLGCVLIAQIGPSSGGTAAPRQQQAAKGKDLGLQTHPDLPDGHRIVGLPSVASWGPGRLDFVVTGDDGIVYHRYYDKGGFGPPEKWEAYPALPDGHRVVGPPSIVSWGPDRLDFVVTGDDGIVYHRYYDLAMNPDTGYGPPDGWEAYAALPGGHRVVGSPSIVSWGPGRLDFLVTGDDGIVYHRYHDMGNYGPPERMGGLPGPAGRPSRRGAAEDGLLGAEADWISWLPAMTGSSITAITTWADMARPRSGRLTRPCRAAIASWGRRVSPPGGRTDWISWLPATTGSSITAITTRAAMARPKNGRLTRPCRAAIASWGRRGWSRLGQAF